MNAAVLGDFLVLPWPSREPGPGVGDDGQGGLLLKCGAVVGVTLICKIQHRSLKLYFFNSYILCVV